MGRRAEGLIDYIAERYRRVVEIGIGRCADVAAALASRGVSVFGTDVVRISHYEVEVFVDDVTMPRLSLYRGVDLVYSLRTPEELFSSIARLAQNLSADAIVKPLSSEYPEGWEMIRRGATRFFLMNGTRRRVPVL